MNIVSAIESSARGIHAQDAVPACPTPDLLRKMHAYRQAANHVSIGQLCLRANPLLEAPLLTEHIEPGRLCQERSAAASNFLYVHLDRSIGENDLGMIPVTGGHDGTAGLAAQRYLEGSSTKGHPAIVCDRDSLQRLFDRHGTAHGRWTC